MSIAMNSEGNDHCRDGRLTSGDEVAKTASKFFSRREGAPCGACADAAIRLIDGTAPVGHIFSLLRAESTSSAQHAVDLFLSCRRPRQRHASDQQLRLNTGTPFQSLSSAWSCTRLSFDLMMPLSTRRRPRRSSATCPRAS